MRFLSVGPEICLQLPSDSTLRWTPLLFGYTFPTTRACSGLTPVRARPWRANIKAIRILPDGSIYFPLRAGVLFGWKFRKLQTKIKSLPRAFTVFTFTRVQTALEPKRTLSPMPEHITVQRIRSIHHTPVICHRFS